MATYRTIHTQAGLAAIAQAEATGTSINLTHMVVGDGNGNPVEPSESQTNLVRELYRHAINRVYQDPTTPNRFTAELVIPASTGGFVLREVGVFDSNGSLFAVGNLPETYKPTSSEGAYADTVLRLDFLVTNANVVTIQIDPNVVVATQTWITQNITAAALIPGGTTGQLLAKQSNADGDYVWQDPTDANVVVNTIEERQTLAANQTNVILATVTTNGLAVYIEGVRLEHATGTDGWQEDVTDVDTTIVLGKSYPAGTKVLLVQNEPLGSVPFPLVQSLNLSDVPNKATARTNLDVLSKAEAKQLQPVGMSGAFNGTTAPTGWLIENGAAISRTAYPELFAAIGTTHGAGDGFNTFNLPDSRNRTIIGTGDLYAVGAKGGSKDAVAVEHTHGVTDPAHIHQYWTGSGEASVFSGRPANSEYGGNFQLLSTNPNTTGISINSAGVSGVDKNLMPYIGKLICIKF